MECRPASRYGHKYTIVVVVYFTKWMKSMSTFVNNNNTTILFRFNHVLKRFSVPRENVIDQRSHF
jgi:hypothetical protein